MEARQIIGGFDSGERERIRTALRRYMREHRIGTPALQVRIVDGDEPRHREIPLSTLQRFITGKHHTQEHHVALCHGFAKALPYYGEGRDIEQLGDALFGFLQAPRKDDTGGEGDEEPAVLIGDYETYVRPTNVGGAFPYPPEQGLPTSRLSLDPVPGKPWLDVHEFVADLLNRDSRPERRYPYDGVLLVAPPLVYIFLRNTLTRQPKSYSLGRTYAQAADGTVTLLEGESFDTWFLRDRPAQRLSSNLRVQFVPAAREDASP